MSERKKQGHAKKEGVITDNKCAFGEVQTMEHIVRSSGLTMDQLFEATPEAVQLAEKWQASNSLIQTCGIGMDTTMMMNNLTIRQQRIPGRL